MDRNRVSPLDHGQNNAQSYWFQRRRIGFGWTPVTWQGWLTVGAFAGGVICSGLVLRAGSIAWWIVLVVLLVLLVVISAWKSEKSDWD